MSDYLVEQFPRIVDMQFTSGMEDQLDEIATGKRQWVPTIRAFYAPLALNIKEKMTEAQAAKDSETETTDKICDKCGSTMVVKRGRFGKFIACSNFPECKNIFKEPKSTAPVEKVGRVCPKDGGELIYRTGRFGKFIACVNFPTCKHTEKIKNDAEAEAAPDDATPPEPPAEETKKEDQG